MRSTWVDNFSFSPSADPGKSANAEFARDTITIE